ncbi:hypothetical protein BO71DRAFT_244496 [Aspergillus ellipticus CBS 707.79]|uniref:Uncharacterized protein n=1 Tax=Aspergillus ellipticus CBS 707.79 TaxID=1448320 RepID=A0A319D939_9EURO|nr:hypothetical protein BO71DRAFT_244496 [Aspergillus ellipticus CBS 707.79]
MGQKVSAIHGVKSEDFYKQGNAINEIWVGDVELISRLPFADSDMAQASWPKGQFPKIPWHNFIIPLKRGILSMEEAIESTIVESNVPNHVKRALETASMGDQLITKEELGKVFAVFIILSIGLLCFANSWVAFRTIIRWAEYEEPYQPSDRTTPGVATRVRNSIYLAAVMQIVGSILWALANFVLEALLQNPGLPLATSFWWMYACFNVPTMSLFFQSIKAMRFLWAKYTNILYGRRDDDTGDMEDGLVNGLRAQHRQRPRRHRD